LARWPAQINSQCLLPTMDQYAGSPYDQPVYDYEATSVAV